MESEGILTVKQISVFLENKPGALAAFVKLVREHNINMRALSIAETQKYGILRIIVSDAQRTVQILKDEQFVASLTPVITVSVSDAPGALCNILETLAGNGINIEYTYAFTAIRNKKAYMVFRTADKHIADAERLLTDRGFKLVSQEDIDNI
ncbi:MAG: ACT domain-containing protein [Synergistes sp.]|nr:ACT domain-containing protein [Synergistes sp.]